MKTLDKMTKAELLAHIAKQDAEIAELRRATTRAAAPRGPSLREAAQRYCKQFGVRSVDAQTLRDWINA